MFQVRKCGDFSGKIRMIKDRFWIIETQRHIGLKKPILTSFNKKGTTKSLLETFNKVNTRI